MSSKRFFKNAKKNKKSNEKRSEFPRNSRTITEHSRFSWPKINSMQLLKLYRGTLKIFVAFIFIIATVIVGFDLQKNLQVKENIDSQREVLINDLNFWEDFISKRQNYPYAYFQASILKYKLGDASKAKEYVEKGLSLDPNSRDGKKIEEILNK